MGRAFSGRGFASHSFGGSRFGYGRSARSFGSFATNRHFVGSVAPHGLTTAHAPGANWRNGQAWDQHRGWYSGRDFHHGYVGWAGGVFWPYADDDLFGYAFYPYGSALFWAYGYDDLFAGVLLPYAQVGPQSGVGALPVASTASPSPAAASALPPAQACASAPSMSGGVSIDAISSAVHPTTDQSAKLDALKSAEANAEQTLAASCATQTPTTAEARLDAVDARLQAMVQASDAVRGPLDDFYSSLSDEQKATFNALGKDGAATAPSQAAASAPANLAQMGGPQYAVPVVATDQIDKAIAPNAKQQASLAALSDAANKADQAILASCPSQAPLTPTGRLDAVRERLQAMLKGVDLVKPPLQDFYASLSDAQKASFDALTLPPASAENTASHT